MECFLAAALHAISKLHCVSCLFAYYIAARALTVVQMAYLRAAVIVFLILHNKFKTIEAENS